MRSACCYTLRGRSHFRRAGLCHVGTSGFCNPWVTALSRRTFSLDTLSSVQPTKGQTSQQACTERFSPSSALTQRNLSAVAVQASLYICMIRKMIIWDFIYINERVIISGSHVDLPYVFSQCRPLCQYDFLDIGEIEDNIQRAQACKKVRHFIVDPDLAKVVTQHLGPDIQDSKTVVFECNPGVCSQNIKIMFI